MGTSSARNAGIESCCWRIYLYRDSDDFIDVDEFESFKEGQKIN